MATERKEAIVADLTTKLQKATAVVLLQAQGLTVKESTELRRKMRAGGMDFQVVKNTLLRLATHNAKVADVDTILNGPTAIALGFDDEISLAKAVADYIRTYKIMSIKAGFSGQRSFNASQVENLAKLPGAQDIRAQAVGTILGPAQQVVNLLGAPARDLVQILRNYAEKQGGTF